MTTSRTRLTFLCSTVSAAAILLLAQGATAQVQAGNGATTAAAETNSSPQLQEVVVTAQKRSQNLQAVPIAVTALSGTQLQARGIQNIEGLVDASPGVFVQEFGAAPSVSSVNIRGVAQLDFADHQESPDALYIDGAYVSFQGATGVGMYDVDQVEILRGPQGTLFGRNATGGLIQINSRKPTDNFGGYIQAEYGSYNQVLTEGALNLPLSNKLDSRFSFAYNRQDGYIHNTLGPNGGGDNTLNGRFQVLFRPNSKIGDDFEVFGTRSFPIAAGFYDAYPTAFNPNNHNLTQPDSGALFQATCAGLGYSGVAAGSTNCTGYREPNNGPWKVSIADVGYFQRTIVGSTNTLTYQLPFGTLTAVTNYTQLNKHYLETDSPQPVNFVGYGNDAAAHQVSQEVRLNGVAGPAHWVVGAYFLNIHGDYDQRNVFGNIYNPDFVSGAAYTQSVTSYAAFGQVDYDLTDALSIIGGLRVGHDDKTLQLTTLCAPDANTCTSAGAAPAGQTVSGTLINTSWSGRLQLTYKLASNVMVYGGVNRGTKGAAIEAPSYPAPNLAFSSLIIKPEELTDYEAGFKSDFFDRRLRLNADIFYYDYHDYQAFKFQGLNSVLFNANAHDYGGEIDMSALITRTLTGTVGVALLHTQVDGVTLPDGTVTSQQQPFSPHASVNAELRQEWPSDWGTIFVDGLVTYNGSRYFSTVNEPSVYAPSYVTGTISIGYTDPSKLWSATLRVKNVNNAIYAIYAADETSLAGETLRNVAPPRWVQFEVSRKF